MGLTLPLGNAIAETYRAIFLNAVLPGGVLGDVDRAVRHGRASGDVGRGARAVAIERTAGQLVLVLAALVVIPTEPAVVLEIARRVSRAPLIGLGRSARRGAGRLAAGPAPVPLGHAAGPTRLRRVLGEHRADVRAGCAGPRRLAAAARPVRGRAGRLPAAVPDRRPGGRGHRAGDRAAAAAAARADRDGAADQHRRLGPREGVAAFTFWMAGLGAPLGVTTSVAYGALALIASLPGGVLLLARRYARTHPPVEPSRTGHWFPLLPTQRSRHHLPVPGLAAEHSEAS